MTDKLTEIIAAALPKDTFGVGVSESEPGGPCYVTLSRVGIAARIAEGIRAAGVVRTEYRQFAKGLPLQVDEVMPVKHVRAGWLQKRFDAWARRGVVVETQAREVVTLVGDWETIQLPDSTEEDRP